MEEDKGQGREDSGESERETVKPAETSGTRAAYPLLITLIGIFCYLGVIIPSVFGSSGNLSYSTFDMLIMMGGAVLVGFGAYFWFTSKMKSPGQKKGESLELV